MNNISTSRIHLDSRYSQVQQRCRGIRMRRGLCSLRLSEEVPVIRSIIALNSSTLTSLRAGKSSRYTTSLRMPQLNDRSDGSPSMSTIDALFHTKPAYGKV